MYHSIRPTCILREKNWWTVPLMNFKRAHVMLAQQERNTILILHPRNPTSYTKNNEIGAMECTMHLLRKTCVYVHRNSSQGAPMAKILLNPSFLTPKTQNLIYMMYRSLRAREHAYICACDVQRVIKTAPVEFLPYKTLFQTPKTVNSDQIQLKSIKST